MKGFTASIILACALPLFAWSTARAGPVTFGFTGTVTSIYDPLQILQGAVVPGDSFLGTYTFDASAADANASNDDLGEYFNAVLDIEGTIGPIDFAAPNSPLSSISVFNNLVASSADFFGVSVSGVRMTGVEGFGRLGLGLRDSTGIVFHDDRLFTIPPPIADFDMTSFTFQNTLETLRLSGELRTFALVPEPSTGLLALALSLAAYRRRR